MNTTSPSEPRETKIADLVAYDAGGQPVLVVDAKARDVPPEAVEQVADVHEAIQPRPPFAMLVGPAEIVLFAWNGSGLVEVARLDTTSILREYDTEFGRKRIFEDYLIWLTEAWLHDIAYRWKSPFPPGVDLLKRVGLADRLAGGTTRSEVKLGRSPLP